MNYRTKDKSPYFFIVFLIITLVSCKSNKEQFLITASSSQVAVDGGMKILEEGGSAMDAALSVALAEIAVTGGKYISYAGIMNLVYYEAKTGTVHNMNAAFNTVENEHDPATIPDAEYQNSTERKIVNGRTILVPGFMKGVEEAHKKFGRIPFEKLFDDAIEICETGIVWTKADNDTFKSWKQILFKNPETKAVFTKADGSYYREGDIFTQPELAETLKRVSQEGSDYMYNGNWARKFVSAASDIGSKITLQDMKNYQVIWSQPLHINYHGYDIYVHGRPAFGGISLIESLNLAEVSSLAEKGHFTESPEAMSTLLQLLKTSFHSFQPEHFEENADSVLESRLKKSTAKLLWEQALKDDETKKPHIDRYKNDHSAAIVAVDQSGNMVAMIHSINTLNWGSNGLFVDGISIPDPATFQQDMIQRTGPGKRLPEATNPGIVMKDGQPVLGFSCIGAGLDVQTFTALINVLDFKMTPRESVKTPCLGPFYTSEDTLRLLIEPNKFAHHIKAEANKLDIHLMEDYTVIGGFWTGIYQDPETRKLSGTDVWMK